MSSIFVYCSGRIFGVGLKNRSIPFLQAELDTSRINRDIVGIGVGEIIGSYREQGIVEKIAV